MDEKTDPKSGDHGRKFSRDVGAQEARKLKLRRKSIATIWFGFGMMGLVGWSVAVPTLVGAALGHWLDEHHPSAHSQTLALLILGLCIGCFNAWRWVAKEERKMNDEGDENDA